MVFRLKVPAGSTTVLPSAPLAASMASRREHALAGHDPVCVFAVVLTVKVVAWAAAAGASEIAIAAARIARMRREPKRSLPSKPGGAYPVFRQSMQVMKRCTAFAVLLVLAGCGQAHEVAPPSLARPTAQGEPRPKAAHCPPSAGNCRAATGRILYEERVDPDGDGDAHFVLTTRGGISLPGRSLQQGCFVSSVIHEG